MLSNITSPYYFSGLEPGVVEQWALVDSNNSLLVVDQDFKLIKFLHMLMKQAYGLVQISKLKNYNPADNTQCLMLRFQNDRIAIQKNTEYKLKTQEKLMYVRSIIKFVLSETDFYLAQNKEASAPIIQNLEVEEEFYGLLFQDYNILSEIYKSEIQKIEHYKKDVFYVRASIFGLLESIDIKLGLTELADNFISNLNSHIIAVNYFENYIKPKLNELYRPI